MDDRGDPVSVRVADALEAGSHAVVRREIHAHALRLSRRMCVAALPVKTDDAEAGREARDYSSADEPAATRYEDDADRVTVVHGPAVQRYVCNRPAVPRSAAGSAESSRGQIDAHVTKR